MAEHLGGQILDEVISNEDLLLEIKETKQVVESVLVKHINGDPSQMDIDDPDQVQGYVATFRIYRNTKFADLKQAACTFW